jgi:hypothetical protein
MEEKDMREARNCGYALLACLALVSTACGVNIPAGGNEGIDEASSDIVECADGTRSDTCGKDGTGSAPPERQCKEELNGCLAQGRDERMCRLQFDKCLASTPPPSRPSPERCKMEYLRCIEVTGNELACRKSLDACMANVPPAP